jgi:small subunit ribosomal protein S16
MQRTGRSGHAMFRLIVQDSHRHPSRGKIVTQLGHYDPHQKTIVLDKEKAAFFLEHGAHPSDRVARLLKAEGITLPKWVQIKEKHARPVKNTDKLRRNRPAVAEEPKPAPKTAEETAEPAEEPKPAPEEVAATEESATPPVEEPESVPDKKPADETPAETVPEKEVPAEKT